MRKVKIIIAMLTGLYIALAVATVIVMKNIEDTLNNEYRVEISRVSRELGTGGILNNKDSGYAVNRIIAIGTDLYGEADYISSVSYMDAETVNAEIISEFYLPKNEYQLEIVPVTDGGSVTGYLRFDYENSMDLKPYIAWSQMFLMLIYIISVSMLTYAARKILRPFHRLSNMPYELSKGNLNDGIDENKSKYFGRFIWGMGMLKDALESNKNREIKLTRDKKMLLLSISHDIKTPLSAINLYAKALEQGIYDGEEEKREALAKIQEKTGEIDRFVKEIIKSSTEDILSIEVNNSEYYLADLAEKVIAGYSEKCSLNKMEFEMGPFDNRLLTGDMDRMYEAIGNLIENAFKYGDGKRLAVTFSEEDYCVLIHVYNSGSPISDSEMPHLFDSFYRGSNTEGKEGNGLGLYICSEIMKKMNGDIFAKQVIGGMEFVLVCQLC